MPTKSDESPDSKFYEDRMKNLKGAVEERSLAVRVTQLEAICEHQKRQIDLLTELVQSHTDIFRRLANTRHMVPKNKN